MTLVGRSGVCSTSPFGFVFCSCLVVVSTLDGTLTALDKEGAVHWIVPPLSGPLLSSSLSTLEVRFSGGDDEHRD